ncbi:MAG: hypothetical protein IJD69_02635 [Alphaproteobacteria bacterium]|nr:hypothetical protein [Alphaproteobacteria bacterium]
MPNLNVGLSLAMSMTPTAHAVVSCQTLERCSQLLLAGYCCCPTGSTGTQKTCPSGWTMNSLQTSCDRSDETGSDSTGSYTLTYTSCSPETSTYDCYTTQAAGTGASTSACYCQSSQT